MMPSTNRERAEQATDLKGRAQRLRQESEHYRAEGAQAQGRLDEIAAEQERLRQEVSVVSGRLQTQAALAGAADRDAAALTRQAAELEARG